MIFRQAAVGHDIDLNAQKFAGFLGELRKRQQTHACRSRDQKVQIAAGPVVTSSDRPEDSHVDKTIVVREIDQISAVVSQRIMGKRQCRRAKAVHHLNARLTPTSLVSRDVGLSHAGAAGHHPAIDLLASASRVMTRVASDEHQASATRMRELLAKYQEIELLVQIGEYQAGSDALADTALAARSALREFSMQRGNQLEAYEDTLAKLDELRGKFGEDHREDRPAA